MIFQMQLYRMKVQAHNGSEWNLVQLEATHLVAGKGLSDAWLYIFYDYVANIMANIRPDLLQDLNRINRKETNTCIATKLWQMFA